MLSMAVKDSRIMSVLSSPVLTLLQSLKAVSAIQALHAE